MMLEILMKMTLPIGIFRINGVLVLDENKSTNNNDFYLLTSLSLHIRSGLLMLKVLRNLV